MVRCAAVTALMSLILICPGTARAQLGFTVTGRYDAVTEGSGRYGSVAFYPLAPFMRGGRFAEGGAGTRTQHGMLFSADVGFTPASGRSFEIGGWFWGTGDSDVFQIHAKHFITREIGVQIGWIGSTRESGNAYTLFGIYDLASGNVAPEAPRKWGVQTGLGIIQDNSSGSDSTDFTMFVQGSVEVGKNISVNATHWYLRNRIVDLNRFALGLGYSF